MKGISKYFIDGAVFESDNSVAESYEALSELKKESNNGSVLNPEKGLTRLRTSYSEFMFTIAGLTLRTALTTEFSRSYSVAWQGIERINIATTATIKWINFLYVCIMIFFKRICIY